MMRGKTILAAVCAASLLFLPACGDSTAIDNILSGQSVSEASTSVSSAESPVASASPSPVQTTAIPENQTIVTQAETKLTLGTSATKEAYASEPESIDVDLSVMSSLMVYSEVFNMMTAPEDYIGKIVKIRGQYYSGLDEMTQKRYFFVLISDATECCQQGMEFIWDDNTHIYPDEYPAEKSQVEIVGTFGVYQEGQAVYPYLSVDDVTVVQ